MTTVILFTIYSSIGNPIKIILRPVKGQTRQPSSQYTILLESPPSEDPARMSSTATSGSASDDDPSYYKTQYEQLEAELADFQASSRELEAELERDIEAAEKRERQLQEKIESLGYEVEEWKVGALVLS